MGGKLLRTLAFKLVSQSQLVMNSSAASVALVETLRLGAAPRMKFVAAELLARLTEPGVQLFEKENTHTVRGPRSTVIAFVNKKPAGGM
jgi:hypothetical protein